MRACVIEGDETGQPARREERKPRPAPGEENSGVVAVVKSQPFEAFHRGGLPEVEFGPFGVDGVEKLTCGHDGRSAAAGRDLRLSAFVATLGILAQVTRTHRADKNPVLDRVSPSGGILGFRFTEKADSRTPLPSKMPKVVPSRDRALSVESGVV